MHHRANCFDLIRHFAALLVLYSHHYTFSGKPEPVIAGWNSLGFLGLVMFFAISGYFMPASYTTSGNFMGFMAKRCRRIFPGMIVCAFLTIYVVCAAFGTGSAWAYIVSPAALQAFAAMVALKFQGSPGVFTDFIYPEAVNGSLWTLPIEFACYLLLGAALTFSNSMRTLLALFIGCVGATLAIGHTHLEASFYSVSVVYLALLGIAFSGGALLSATQARWWPYRALMGLTSLALPLVFQGSPDLLVVGLVCFTVLTVVIGVSFKDRLIRGRFDLSYGIYIYAFPIQQLVINRVTNDFWPSMAVSTVLTVAAGYLSFRYVENPFLRRKRREPVYAVPVAT